MPISSVASGSRWTTPKININMAILTIDYKNFLAGESQWDWIPNRGFSPESYGLNLLLKPGVLNFGWTQTDRGGATLTGNIIASTYDKNINGNDTYHVDDEGNFYTLNGATFTKRVTSGNSAGWQLGTTDIIQFKGNTYATRAGATTADIIQMQGSDLTGGTTDNWWTTGFTTGYRMPLEVVEDSMYIGNMNVVYYFNGTTSGTAVTLPTDCNITSLRRHPDGRRLIAFTGYQPNFSHTNGGPGKVYIINKNTQTWEQEILIGTQVEGSRNVEGTIYVTSGKKLGYFTGSGIKYFKQLKTSGTTYSHNLGNIEDLLIVRDGTNLLCYGDLGNGSNSWHNIYQAPRAINNIIYKGMNSSTLLPTVLVAYSDGAGGGVLNELTTTKDGTTGQFVSNRYNFGQTVKIRRAEILHDAKSAAGVFVFSFYSIDSDDTQNLFTVNYPVGPTANKTRIGLDITTDVFQFKISPSNGALAIKSIRIYYDPID